MLKQDITDIPNYGRVLDASNSFIVDQGIAIFAVVVFAIVIFGMMGLMFMAQRQAGAMLRQMGKESNQQDKLITQNDLNRVAAQRNTDELIDVKQLLARLIDMQTEGNSNNNVVIQESIASIDKNTESVDTMNGKLEELEKTIGEMVVKINAGVSLDADSLALMKQFIDRAKQLEETLIRATQETPVIPPETPKEETPKLAVPPTRADKQEKTE